MDNITKEKLTEELKHIAQKRAEQKARLEKTKQAKQDLLVVEQTTFIELAKLEGEERAVRALLSTLEPPKEDTK